MGKKVARQGVFDGMEMPHDQDLVDAMCEVKEHETARMNSGTKEREARAKLTKLMEAKGYKLYRDPETGHKAVLDVKDPKLTVKVTLHAIGDQEEAIGNNVLDTRPNDEDGEDDSEHSASVSGGRVEGADEPGLKGDPEEGKVIKRPAKKETLKEAGERIKKEQAKRAKGKTKS